MPDPNVHPGSPGGLIVDLEELLGRRVDVAEPESLHWFIRDQVMSEARAFINANENLTVTYST